MSAIPKGGKNRTNLPSTVNLRKRRVAREGLLSPRPLVNGQTAQVSRAPPQTRNGIASHSRIVPLGRSIINPTPAEVVRRAVRMVIFRKTAILETDVLSPMASFLHPVSLIRRLATRYRRRETSDYLYSPTPFDEFGRLGEGRRRIRICFACSWDCPRD